ncbi:MAG: DUF4340 domain-containing protein [Ruminococcaceae bacterium]|nr:DUF4340 domain-containing protein [Oscillospiraceae bacterium]
MSDFMSDNENITGQEDLNQDLADISDTVEGEEEFSTIFSAPAEKKPATVQNAKKKRIISMVAAVLAVVILIGGSAAIVKLIPKKEEDEAPVTSNDISVLELDSNMLDKVSITNKNGKFVFTADRKTETDDEGKETVSVEWSSAEIEDGVLSSDEIGNIISSLDNITATREITAKSAADCGLQNPSRQIDIESEKYGNFSVIIGSDSPDNTGTYLKLSTKDTIYLVESSLSTGFDFTYLDLANVEDFKAITVTDAMKDYTDEEGKLAFFDTLTISGKNFNEPMVFVKNNEEFLSGFVPYSVSSPVKQDADNLTDVMALFTSGLTSSGAYSLEINDDELSKVGLDNPDMVISISVAGVTKTYKIAVVDQSFCAVIDDESRLIQKVSKEALPFVDYKMDNFYSKWVFLRSIDNLNSIVFETGDKKYSFDISYTEEDNTKTYTVLSGGKEISAENFQDFYVEFVGLQASDFDIGATDTAPEMTVTANHKNGKTEVLTFTRSSATKFQFALNGEIKGRITSSSYNKVFNYLKLVAEDKKIK